MLEILYEDKDILVCHKPVGVESQSSRSFEPDMVSLVRNHLAAVSAKAGYPPYVGVIHRLDKPVEGVMVYGKNEKAAKALSYQLQNHQIKKKYYALVCGKPVDKQGRLVDYLWKDVRGNASKVVNEGFKGGKKAILDYCWLKDGVLDGEEVSLVEVSLITGRHHQIRVQLSQHGFPLWGDLKYNPSFHNRSSSVGSNKASLALCAYQLSFLHPITKNNMAFEIMPKGNPLKNFILNE